MFSKAVRAYEKGKNLKDVERVIKGEVLRRAEKISSSQVFNVGVILAYLALKEAEINRVTTILGVNLSYQGFLLVDGLSSCSSQGYRPSIFPSAFSF